MAEGPQMQPPEPPRVGTPEQLTALEDQCRAGQKAAQAAVVQAMQAGMDPTSIKLLEVGVRLNVLSDALYGDGTPDQLLYESTCHQRFLAEIAKMMEQAGKLRAEHERQLRQAQLLQGVQVNPGALGR